MNSETLVKALRKTGLLKLVPKHVKLGIKSHLDFEALNRADWQQTYDEIMARAKPSGLVTDREVCIVHDWMLRHAYYEAACKEEGVPYHILDLTSADWVSKAEQDQSFAYLFRPFVLSTLGRAIYEERAYFLKNILGKPLFPDFNALWIYECKRRCASWLKHYGIPHPKTWVFFSKAEARAFVETTPLPIVFKTDIGSDAVGVRILKSKKEAFQLIDQCFGKGFSSSFYDPRDRNYGQVFFQEYLADVVEWRIIRIGESFFAYQKGKKGDFHSGSKIVDFCRPSERLLDFSRNLLERVGTKSMSLDIFEDRNGNYFVNEMQTYYGANETGGYYYEDGKEVTLKDGQTIEMMVDGESARYFWDEGKWNLETGDFSRNAGCNLRVRWAFQELGEPLPGFRV